MTSLAGLKLDPLTAATAPMYAKLAAVTLLPAIVGGMAGHQWKAHHAIGMALGALLLPVATIYAVNRFYPTGIRGFVGP